MHESGAASDPVFRNGTAADVPACVSLWAEACAARDGRAIAGVAERATLKFERAEAWIVAERSGSGPIGFVLATPPRSGLPTDPPSAPVIGLLAVAPHAQGGGLGGKLLVAVTAALARRGHRQSVLHVLTENHPAVRLYARTAWRPSGEPFEHALLKRPTQTYVLDLHPLLPK